MPPRTTQTAQIRSGRFKTDNATSPLVIISGRSSAFYRIFNTGTNAFKVLNGVATTVEEGGSVDVVVRQGETVRISTDSVAAIEGVYELVKDNLNVRSGHFQVVTDTDSNDRRIIDLRPGGGGGGGPASAYYRVYNSGSAAFTVTVGTQAFPVAVDNSLDFEIPTTGGDRTVKVKADPSTPFEGIYEYLGSGT
ncbi:MAG: hypothetical protein KDA75_15965 [Planctomycetaceae bacterium]|nr:hypothetical protein [Planctomycetaceae bacterium]